MRACVCVRETNTKIRGKVNRERERERENQREESLSERMWEIHWKESEAKIEKQPIN